MLTRANMDNPIRIVIANDHPIIRSDLRLLLERQPNFHVVGEAANGRETVVLVEYRHPDVVLLDIKLPEINGMAAAREISSQKPGLGILFITALTDEEYISEAFKAGARGYVLAGVAQTDLPDAVRVVAGGGSFLSPAITARLMEEAAVSERDKQLCCLLAAGCGGEEEIAALGNILHRIELPPVVVASIRANRHAAITK